MFMVKDEFANVQNLFKIRLKPYTKAFIWLFIIFALILLASLAGTVLMIIENIDGFSHNIVTDPSVTILICVFIGYSISVFMYRSANDKLSVYPQTNNSRYISWLLVNYSMMVIFALLILVPYLIHYGVIMLMSAFNDSIHLALNVDFGFIVIGFFVYLIYSFLIISVVELIGAAVRKWSYYAIVTLAALLTLMMVNLERVIENIPKVLSFLIFEPSLILFFLKAVGIWLGITAVTLILNHYTVYHKSQNWVLRRRIVIACVIIAVLITILTPILFRFDIVISSNTPASNTGVVRIDSEWSNDQVDNDSFITRAEEIRIDISHLPAGVNINIQGENINVIEDDSIVIWSSNLITAYINNVDSLTDVHGDTLVIQYWKPWFMVNGIEISKFADPQVTAYLDGDTLFINYTFNRTTVIILPIWSIVRQFDIFKDKGVLTGHALGSSGGGSMSVNIFIEVE